MTFRLLAASASIASFVFVAPALSGNPIGGVGVSVKASRERGAMRVASATPGFATPPLSKGNTNRITREDYPPVSLLLGEEGEVLVRI
jgi:hypothetical protein